MTHKRIFLIAGLCMALHANAQVEEFEYAQRVVRAKNTNGELHTGWPFDGCIRPKISKGR